ncbi:MAG TPA: elongation factor G [Planctomycetota bacterium]|jgi:elongation factor G|nr:elongation factor G [Planctomycetota bacterium]OQC21309.1 MAG: Elongation factor G [Planctomycetes bacterium ADurb.Bin069]NMD34838.1 elongation factor G [Planctomycetota bacterium]HNR99159.1 elongation factor G [Planctomycetota bacterium]HNU25232.1 elongation factor G [Planctomycetota bacterium]
MAAGASTIRNIAVVGQEASGKTTLIEALLHHKKQIHRLGSVVEGNTVCDFEAEEKEQRKSMFPAVVNLNHKGLDFTLVDTPGSLDFLGQTLPVLGAVECAVCCIDCASSVKITSRRVWKALDAVGLPRVIAVTRQDAENCDFERVVRDIQATFGARALPLYYPNGAASAFTKIWSVLNPADDAPPHVKQARDALVEAIVEADDAVLEKYFEDGGVSEEDLARVFAKAVREMKVIPVFVVSALGAIGLAELLDGLAQVAPPPDALPRTMRKGEEELPLEKAAGLVGQVFKVWADDFLARLSYIRIFAGEMTTNGSFTNTRTGETDKYGNVLAVQGKETKSIERAGAGRIIAVGRVEDMMAGDTVADAGAGVAMPVVKLPTPLVSLAVRPKARGDEQRLTGGVRELACEDPCFVWHFEAQTKELVISGLSDFHINTMLKRMKRRRKVELETKPPRIPYLETVTKTVKYVEYTHKKQTGGAGQFARVFIDLEPRPRGSGYEFVDKIFGGVIDLSFRPSVDKGVRDKMAEGVLAGYPVVDCAVTLVDGKTHPVDSKDIAFQIAGREAFKKAFAAAGPVLLEPLVKLEVTVPQQYMGTIMGDLNGRRGRILNTGSEGSLAVITAQVPLAEIQNYAADLKSITGGEGTFEIEHDRYEVVPSHLQQQIVERSKAEHKEKEEE